MISNLESLRALRFEGVAALGLKSRGGCGIWELPKIRGTLFLR